MGTKETSSCIQCGLCTEHCDFLKKYDLITSDLPAHPELAYHCFLCNRCEEICPVSISGRDIVMDQREEAVALKSEAFVAKDYSSMLNEKIDYKFRNYRNSTEGTVLFPGCNFPSLFPKTNAELARRMKEEYGIGIVYDCCGKPIAELGMKEDEERILRTIEENLISRGVSEIVTACPNCFYFLNGRINVKVTGIYDKIRELGMPIQLPKDRKMYVPCPDRSTHQWVDSIGTLVGEEPQILEGPQCCGLGASAGVREPRLAKGFAKQTEKEVMNSFCASCAGQFARNGNKGVRHILSEMLGVQEKPAILTSYIHRMRTKNK